MINARPARLFLLALTLALNASAHETRDMELVGAHGLQGRSAYQPVIQQQGERWIAYVGHHAGRATNPLTGREEDSGTSIVLASNLDRLSRSRVNHFSVRESTSGTTL